MSEFEYTKSKPCPWKHKELGSFSCNAQPCNFECQPKRASLSEKTSAENSS